jgi:peptide/nickel transport system ATP-binding protein
MIRLDAVSRTFVIREGFRRDTVHAVTDASLVVAPSETLAVVGESGCGKSTLGRIVAGIIPPTGGRLFWNDRAVDPRDRRAFRRYQRAVQLVHQDPYAALNPVRRVGQMLAEPLQALGIVGRGEVRNRVAALLRQVGLDSDQVARSYPHQLSGGQRQRILLARALTVEPQFLVADEAVSMVDVSQRLGILELFRTIMRERHVGLVFITHDLRVARYIAGPGHMAVMYLGRIVEYGPTERILENPGHPYTQCLVSAVPLLRGREAARIAVVEPKSYDVPDAVHVPDGCAFESRCPFAVDACRTRRPDLTVSPADARRQVACHLAEQFVETPSGVSAG